MIYLTMKTWRDALTLLSVPRSKFSPWEPFRTQSGQEVIKETNHGTAYATDGVHILIECNGDWFSRHSKVVQWRSNPEGGGLTRPPKEVKERGPSQSTLDAKALADEYGY